MDAIADDEPPPDRAYLSAVARRQITVVDDETPVAYLWAFVVDGSLHIEQVSVAATHARRGIGRRLIDHAADAARSHGLDALTLTTFADVPWNGPYYEALGFRPLPEVEWTAGLRRIRHEEAAHGLDRWLRVCMRRDV